MKIAVFIKSTTFHKNHGGLETQNKAVCEELVKRGHIVAVFSPKNELVEENIEQNGVKYIFIEADYKNYLFSSFRGNSWYNRSLEVFSKIQEEEKFDVVLSQSAAAESIIENKNKLGVKTVSLAHGTALSEYVTFLKNISNLKDIYWLFRNTQYFLRQYFGRQRRYILHANKVIAVSNYVKEALIKETFISGDKIGVVHNGIDGSLFGKSKMNSTEDDDGEKKEGSVKAYFIGRVEKSKGIMTAIEVLRNLDGDLVFHVVGDGPCLEDAKSRVKTYRLEERVVFHGRVSHSEFIKSENPDVLVFPTQRIEGFPMVLVESMFAEIPVVAFDCGGVSDAIEDGKTGYLIKSGDIRGFEEGLRKIIGEEYTRVSFGKNARQKAEKEFTLGRMIDSYEKIFSEVLK